MSEIQSNVPRLSLSQEQNTVQNDDDFNLQENGKGVEKEEKMSEGGKSTPIGVAMTFVSNIIGGGIISVPYAMTSAGLQHGIMVNIMNLVFTMIAVHLYIRAKEILGFDSISEISYICLGRPSIFLINGFITFVIFGILTLYLLLFSKISISLLN